MYNNYIMLISLISFINLYKLIKGLILEYINKRKFNKKSN